jgi:drug/metabolite transporter (DMT)-like permease
LFSSAANFFLFSSVQLGDPTVVAFFSRSETVFSLLWGVVFLKEHLTKVQWLGAMTAIIGAGIMTYQGETIIWIVLLLAIAANFFNATSSYVAKRNIINISPAVLGLARTIILTLTLGIIGLLAGKLAWPSLRTLLWIIGGSFVGPFLSYIFFYKGLAYIDMGQAAIIRATQPLFVAVYSLALFGRTIGIVQFAGGLVISIGVFMMLSKGASKQIFSLANPLLIFIQRRTTNRK